VRKIPKSVFSDSLENHFARFGDIISCKVSLNEDHTSRGYGFVCFKDPESVAEALKMMEKSEEMQAVKFAPKSKADLRKVFNNIYVKNFPDDWTEVNLRQHFS
jgi:polyadenylate-binding protein